MKVKEIYHYLTVLSSWEDNVKFAMMDRNLYTKVVELHKKQDIISTENNEEKEVVNKEIEYTVDDLINLWDAIIEEKKKIYALIEKKKQEKNLPDEIFTINKSYRDMLSSIKSASNMSKKSMTKRKETGFIKSNEGVGTYTYEVEVNSIPKYESKYFIEKLDKYQKVADDNSNMIDSFNTNEEIDYVPKWSEFSQFEDLLK